MQNDTVLSGYLRKLFWVQGVVGIFFGDVDENHMLDVNIDNVLLTRRRDSPHISSDNRFLATTAS